MVMRKIIKIDEELCTGCGECIPNCPEGAIQLIDDKARIISDIFCDGLGACIGHCPMDAISIEEREAEEYNEKTVMANVVKQGPNVIKAHLEHLRDHDQHEYLKQAIEYLKENNMEVPIQQHGYEHGHGHGHDHEHDHEQKQQPGSSEPLPCGCPGSAVQDLRSDSTCAEIKTDSPKISSQLRQWPVQLMLVPPTAPYLKGAELLIAADCVPVAYPNFHNELLKGKIILIGCPKFDNIEYYKNKLIEIFKYNDIKSISIVMMEVPCCFGLYKLVIDAVSESGKEIPISKKIIGVKGEILED